MNADLALGKKADCFLSLGMQDSVKGAGHAAKGIECHGRDDSEIDTNVAAVYLILELPGISTV